MPYENMTTDELRQLAREMILSLTEEEIAEILAARTLAENKAG